MTATRTRRSLLTPQEAAEVLRINKSTMYRWIKDGKVPFIRLPSGDVRIDEKEFDAWLSERSRKAR
jgi:excisionase family DNA binding protein